MEKFRPGEEVVLISHNRFGGPGCGEKGVTGVVIKYHSDKNVHPKTLMVNIYTLSRNLNWWCHEDDLEPVMISYDPLQQGDTDDDI